jgi:hypothetical protein
MSQVEQAGYDAVETQGSIEIRDYAPMTVAEVSVSGDREKAINDGFRKIADYIFGNNVASQKVAMTAPVIQQPSLAMKSSGSKITCVVPSRYGVLSW